MGWSKEMCYLMYGNWSLFLVSREPAYWVYIFPPFSGLPQRLTVLESGLSSTEQWEWVKLYCVSITNCLLACGSGRREEKYIYNPFPCYTAVCFIWGGGRWRSRRYFFMNIYRCWIYKDRCSRKCCTTCQDIIKKSRQIYIKYQLNLGDFKASLKCG